MDLTATLSELISIPSVNPMGRPVEGPEYFEYRVTDYLQSLFTRLGLPWQRQPIEPKRENILVRVEGDPPPASGGRLLLFEAHQDTVPVDGMTIDPFLPAVREGRIYGRGACDIKGGMTAMLGAVARLAKEKPAGRPTVVMACTVNEEHGYTGASSLPKLWKSGADSIVPRRPDAAVVAEPTNLNVVVAHKGAVRWRCRTTGRACHSSQPHLGDNAFYKMARVLLALEAYQKEFIPTLNKHPLCGPASLSVGTIAGGISVNTVPDECVIEIDRRILPGEDSRTAYRQVTDWVRSYRGIDFEVLHDEPFMAGSALPDDKNAALADELAAAAGGVAKCGKIGVPFGTDAATISLAGVPSVVFGPGSIDQAHTCDEWLDLGELEQASEVLYRFAARA
jgi:acetylornithine deacetylase